MVPVVLHFGYACQERTGRVHAGRKRYGRVATPDGVFNEHILDEKESLILDILAIAWPAGPRDMRTKMTDVPSNL